jgi:prepilin-type N-terminal cleavage/methylation domain-containing protein
MLSDTIKNQAGFTLLELLIALAILGLVMGIIYEGMGLGARAWRVGEARMERNQRLRLVLNQLAEEIRSAYSIRMKGETKEDKYQAFWGEAEKIRFVTVTAGLLSEPLENKLRAVSYYVDGDDGLVFKETILNYDDFFSHLETQPATVLDPEVAQINFRYYYVPEEEGKEGEEKIKAEGIWTTEWDPTDKENKLLEGEGEDFSQEPITARQLPNAVEITLTMKPEHEGGEPKTIPPLIAPIFWGRGVTISDEKVL